MKKISDRAKKEIDEWMKLFNNTPSLIIYDANYFEDEKKS